jgi:peptide/nickel transport system substrate-binding protein
MLRRASAVCGLVPKMLALTIVGHLAAVVPTQAREPIHGLAMHGAPLHPRGFTSFSAVNPDAPKGGRFVQGVQGSYDSVNPFIIRGVAAAGVRDNVTESLLARGLDEPFTLYGLIAQSIELPDDRSEVTFNLDPRARFSDGHPITADDIIFSFNALREKGRPNHRAYFKKVADVQRVSDRKIRFMFADGGDRELPLILGLMPVFPAHVLTPETFEQTSLEPFIGSGPYKMARIDAGRAIVYARDPNYWGRDLPVNRGRYNVDELRFEYFRDNNVMFEAFKNGDIDVRFEDDPALWSQGYDFAAIKDGRIVKTELETFQPAGMSALVFNTRRPLFAHPKVRQALIQMFDFEFANRSLFNGLYKRTQSFFERSMLSSVGRTADGEEVRLMAPYRDTVRPDVMDGSARLPETDGTGRNRVNLGKALALLTEAGFTTVEGKLIDPATKRPMAFEILVSSIQKVLPSFVADLARIGVTATIRQVDQAQFQARLRIYDYDMIPNFWASSLSPGNEQTFRWSGKVAKEEGSFNFAGVDQPAVDAMIDAMLSADTSEAFTSSVRALDRVLRSGDYVIPLYHVPRLWVAHARRIKYPPRLPLAGLAPDTWWVEGK